jgi:hypothetical protein
MPTNRDHYLLRSKTVEYDEIAHKVESYYDRQTRSWVSFLVNRRGDQLGDASYDGTKDDRDASMRALTKKLGTEVS